MTENQKISTKQETGPCLRKAVDFSFRSGLSFALWKLPGNHAIYFAGSHEPVSTHDIVLEDSQPGFLFAPFDPGERKIFLPADEFFVCEDGVLKEGTLPTLAETDDAAPEFKINPRIHYSRPFPEGQASDQAHYEQLVEQCRDAVIGGTFEKLVASRYKEVELTSQFDLATLFLALGSKYPNAMVSVFSSLETGTWIGATPETLVKLDSNQHFHTAAVAGTQPFVPGTDLKSITWNQKEIEEQALVERYIISCLKKIRLREFDEYGPKTVIAGNVVHLRTDFEVDMLATRYPQLGSVMLQLLHPTSAVCGMPLEASLAFLKKHEGYSRQYYSGYLGPVRVGGETQLFVNLRCMQLGTKTARLYAGGGVLGDSDPEKEWQETELKMNTLLDIIRQ